MDPATQTHLTSLRALLNQRMAEMRAEIQASQQARAASSDASASAHEVEDRKDEAAQQQFDRLGDVQEQRDIDELRQIESALVRLDEGVYGDCADCGEAIPLERLRVQPAALRCARCQEAVERTLASRR